jgi:hypothetical protein
MKCNPFSRARRPIPSRFGSSNPPDAACAALA